MAPNPTNSFVQMWQTWQAAVLCGPMQRRDMAVVSELLCGLETIAGHVCQVS